MAGMKLQLVDGREFFFFVLFRPPCVGDFSFRHAKSEESRLYSLRMTETVSQGGGSYEQMS